MGTWPKVRLACCMLTAGALLGCTHGNKPLHYFGDADLKYYKRAATQIDYPNVCEPVPEEVLHTKQPHTIGDRNKGEVWELPLYEAIQIALTNNRIIRGNAQFLSTGSQLLNNGDFNPSVYDPAIQESGVLFGGRGVEAALSDFDAQFTTSMIWGRNETVQNSAFTGSGVEAGNTQVVETGSFMSALEKQFAYGGTFRVAHDVNYLGINSPAVLFPSSYSGNVRAEYRQPLWAGSGTEYTRIAGPLNPGFRGITGVSQGVVIARINNDITIAEFEISVRNLLRDVEQVYWDLYLQYRLFDTAVTARNSALRSWREAQAKLEVGGAPNFKPADEAQARDQYFQLRSAAQTAQANIFATEVRLRRLLGLPVNDGRMIRPLNEPTTAQLVPEWHVCLGEALTFRTELRKQKFNIKSLELQLRAARSLTKPRLDFISSYQVNGFGNRLFGEDDDDGITAQGLDSFYETITQGDQTGWNLGFEFSVPIGFRSALAQVRNIELRLAKAREVLATQEMEVSHELAAAIQDLSAQYVTAQSNFNRMRAAAERVRLFEAEFDAGTATLDLVLRAQASLAEAERDFYTSIVSYNQAIAELELRKGTLLAHDNVHLAEGEWKPEAYQLALRRAWARSHALRNDLLHSEPEEFIIPGGVAPVIDLGHGPHDESLEEPLPANIDQIEEAPEPEVVPDGTLQPEPDPFRQQMPFDDPDSQTDQDTRDDDPFAPIPAEPEGAWQMPELIRHDSAAT